jgi:DNA-binding NtrC family response regulator
MTPTEKALRVLVVDDELLIRWSIGEMLTQHGHTVVEATSASNTRDVLSGADPIDVVLLDYRLPDSNDLQLLAEVRRRMPDTAVVLMTAHGTPEVARGALQLGAYRVINKPFDMHEVNALVRNAYHATHPLSR